MVACNNTNHKNIRHMETTSITNEALTSIRDAAHAAFPNVGPWRVGFLARKAMVTLDLYYLASPKELVDAARLDFISDALADTTAWDVSDVIHIAMEGQHPYWNFVEITNGMWKKLNTTRIID